MLSENIGKKIIKSVRTFLIENNKVIAINYKKGLKDFYDIPGGKIEEGETSNETSIREFKEETGIIIKKQHHMGYTTIEYPDKIYELDIYIVDEYYGKPIETDDNRAMWFNIDKLYEETKIIPSIEIIKYLKENMNVKIMCDINHKIINIESK